MPKNILIIEDDSSDFRKIQDGLFNYNVFPNGKREQDDVKRNLQNWIDRSNSDLFCGADKFFNDYFEDKHFDAIILDIKLGTQTNDRSGLIFLEYLRNKYFDYIPIVMLSSLDPRSVQKGLTNSSGMANYYLHKGSGSERLSKEFFEYRLLPVLTMLIHWKNMILTQHIVNQVVKSNLKEIFEAIDTKFETIVDKINFLAYSNDQLIEYSKANLTLIKYNIKLNDRKADLIIRKFLDDINLSENLGDIDKYKPKLIEILNSGFIDIKEAIKGEGKKEVTDLLISLVKNGLSISDDQTIIKELLVLLCSFIRNNLKTILLV